GDSRAYISTDEKLQQITIDHTVVQALFEQGKITQPEMREHPQKNYITKAVGTSEIIEPDYFEIDIYGNEKILMCSDGLTNYSSDEEIFDIINKNSLEDALDKLLKLALSKGGNDNVTLMLIAD
ncbi:MAG: serine/threonine-protein phosphatase, partial [Oscillospiraceae bacterium]